MPKDNRSQNEHTNNEPKKSSSLPEINSNSSEVSYHNGFTISQLSKMRSSSYLPKDSNLTKFVRIGLNGRNDSSLNNAEQFEESFQSSIETRFPKINSKTSFQEMHPKLPGRLPPINKDKGLTI